MSIPNSTMELSRNTYKVKTDSHDYINREKSIDPHSEALKIAFLFGVISFLWILVSSEFIHSAFDDIIAMKKFELIKGWFYVIITAIMLYIMIEKRLTLFKVSAQKNVEAYEELNAAYKTLMETEEQLKKSYDKIEQQRSALEASEQRYKLAVHGSNDGIWDWDIQNNRLFYSVLEKDNNESEQCEITLGLWKELLHPEDRNRVILELDKYLISGQGIYKDTYRIREADGNYLWIFSRGQAIWDGDGNAIRIAGSHTDITEQIKLQELFQEAKELSDNIFDNVPIIIAVSDLQGKVIKCNQYTEQVMGYDCEELIGSQWIGHHIPKEHKKDIEQVLKKHQKGQLVTSFEGELVSKNGQRINILWTNGFLYNDDGSTKAILFMGVDVTYLKTVEKKLYHMAYYDGLTELPNRIWFEEEGKKILLGKLFSNGKLALVHLGIDNLKYLNVSMGYQYGDQLLQYISNLLKHHIKHPNIVAHMAGDEFIVLLHDVLDISDIISGVENIQRLVNRTWQIEKHEIFVSASIGVAVYPEHGHDLSTLLKNAETAMYTRKKAGKSGYNIYSEILANKALEYNWMINELRKAIKNKEFIVYYQPLIDFESGQISGVEALIRWNHLTKGWISPSVFIPVAEASGLILDIGKWVFYKACEQKKIWNEKGYPDIKMSINLSRRELTKEGLFTDIKQIIEMYNLEYSSIQVEITETAAMTDLDKSINILQQLKSLGVMVALDDFGTGYSSLNCLKTLPIDVIKLDGSFVKRIQDQNEEEEIINTVIKLAHILNLEVVAECVETREQLEFLRKHHCNGGQGYLFSKPLAPEEIGVLLESNDQYI